jgi:hypothetical protein
MNDSNRIVIVTTKLVKYKEILKILMFSILKVVSKCFRTYVQTTKKTLESVSYLRKVCFIVLSVAKMKETLLK